MKKSNRSNVDPFIVMDVMEAARKAEESGRKVIHMEVGQPGTPAPKLAKERIKAPEDPVVTITLSGFKSKLYHSP